MGEPIRLALAKRRLVLVLLPLLAGLAALGIPRLRAVFAPEEMVPPNPAEEREAEALLGAFDGRQEALLVLLSGDVLSDRGIDHLHALARHLEAGPWFLRVEGPTTSPLPHLVAEAGDAAGGPTLDDLDTLADPEPDPQEALLGRVLSTAPERFPLGLLSFSQEGGDRRELAPLVAGEVPTSAERDLVREVLRTAPLLEGRMVGDDGRLVLLAAIGRQGLEAADWRAAVDDLAAWQVAHPAPAGVRVSRSGIPEVRVAMEQALVADQILVVGLAVLGSFLVLLIAFRSVAGVVLPLAAAGMSAGIVVGGMGWLGEPINLLNNVVPCLLITIGLGDAVHLLMRYREELVRTSDRVEAVASTARAMLWACFLTSATTAIGFGSLVFSQTAVMQRFGLVAALGVMVAYAVTVLFLPASLPSHRMAPACTPGPAASWLRRVVEAAASAVLARPLAVVTVALLALAGSLFVGRLVRMDSTLVDQLDPRSEVRRTVALLEDELDGIRTLEIGFQDAPGTFDTARGLRRVGAIAAWLETEPEVLRVGSPQAVLEAVWDDIAGADAGSAFDSPQRAAALVDLARSQGGPLLGRHLSEDGSRARLDVRLRDTGERGLNTLLDRLEGQLASVPGTVVLGGEAYHISRGLQRLVADLQGSLLFAVVVIFAAIGLLLRSPRLGLCSILPNVLPLAVTVAWMSLRGIPLHAATAIVFSVSIGLAVDGTIHILARYREELAGGRTREDAARVATVESGRAVLVGALTLLVGFAALLFASFMPIRWFGELSIVAIGTSLFCEVLVLPAVLVLFGPRRAGAVLPAPALDVRNSMS
jgi:predicted RND superfamily exporter protein